MNNEKKRKIKLKKNFCDIREGNEKNVCLSFHFILNIEPSLERERKIISSFYPKHRPVAEP